MSKKITRATIKSFIKKANNLHIKFFSSFDSSQDCVMPSEANDFTPTKPADRNFEYTLGIFGALFLLGDDRYTAYETEHFTGYKVSNCCTSFAIAVPK
jgi:hypothetical protein